MSTISTLNTNDTGSDSRIKLNDNFSALNTDKVETSRTVNGHALSSNVTVTASDLSLGNVDNTSDANKPVSTATQTALDLKLNTSATTASVPDSSNKRYVTDAQLTVIGNTSGTNTGDQTLPVDSTLTFTDITTNDSSTTKHGFLKKLSNISTQYMDGTGAWSTPAGGSGSLKLPTYTVGASGADFTTIQGALDAATAGGKIYLTDASYTITTGLTFKGSNVEIVGNNPGGTNISFNGATVTTLIKTNSAGAFYYNNKIRNLKITQTNGTIQGIAIDASDMALCTYEDIVIDSAGTGIKIVDTVNITFYNTFRNVRITGCNNGIDNNGSTSYVNDNWFYNIRCDLVAGGAGIGLRLVKAYSNSFINCNFEPGSSAGITGVHLVPASDGDVADTSFVNLYCEANDNNVIINLNTQRTSFFGGQIVAGATSDMSDSGQDTNFFGTDVGYALKNQFAHSTFKDVVPGGAAFTFTDGTSFAHATTDLVGINLLNTGDSSDALRLNHAGTMLNDAGTGIYTANALNIVAGNLAYVPVTKTQITSNQNNYVLGAGINFRMSTDASRTITGLSATGATDGRQVRIRNVGSFAIVFANESASSSAANRITTSTAANITLAAKDSITFTYDSTSSRWYNQN